MHWIFVALGLVFGAGCALKDGLSSSSVKITSAAAIATATGPAGEVRAPAAAEASTPIVASTAPVTAEASPATNSSTNTPTATPKPDPAPAKKKVTPPPHCKVAGPLAEATADLVADLAGLGGSGTLILRERIALAQSLEIPVGVRLCFDTAGAIETAAAVTLKLAAFDAKMTAIFPGAGAVSLDEASPKALFPQWFGAAGNGATDDAAAFRRALATLATGQGRALLLGGKSYAMTLNPGLVVPEGNGLDGQGGTITARLTGDTEYPYMSDQRHLLAMRSRTFLKNVTLDNVPMPRSAISVLRHHVQVGRYEDGRGFRDVRLEGLTLKGGVDGEIGINVWGDSANVIIRNIKFPANPSLGTAIAVQWSWDPARLYDANGNLRKSWTGHPHDVLIENIEIESMTGLGTSSDGNPIDLARSNCFDVCGNWGIWLSAPYNVHVKNVRMGTVATGVMAYAGDFGNFMAEPRVKPLVGTGIVVEDVHIERAFLRGFVVSGLPNYKDAGVPNFSEYLEYVDMPVTFKNVKARGVGLAGRLKNTAYWAGQGLLTYYTKGVWFYNSDLEDFAYGMEVYEGVSLLYVEASRIRRSSYGGISLIGSSRHRAQNISIKTTEISDANMMQTGAFDAAAISIGENVDGVVIDSCHVTAYTPYYQFVGVYILGGNYHYLSNNWVSAVGPDGAGFGTKGGVTSKWYIRNNGAEPGIPVYFGDPEYF